jgi:predicted enzyme related to lactoylglutathione lyase
MPSKTDPVAIGSPQWLSLAVTEVDEAVEFYARVFGWRLVDCRGSRGAGAVCRAARVRFWLVDQDEPEGWTTHFEVRDLATATSVVRRAGGYVGPVRVYGDGVHVVHALDPTGAALALRSGGPAGESARAGALAWSDLHTRNYEAALRFYSALFHYAYLPVDQVGAPYSMFYGDESSGAGLIGGIQHNTALPDVVPSFWLPWLTVADVDGASERALALGSSVLTPVASGPFGRMGVVKGPWGEVFGLVEAPARRLLALPV